MGGGRVKKSKVGPRNVKKGRRKKGKRKRMKMRMRRRKK